MRKNQRHKLEYLLHLVDDNDLKAAAAILAGKLERRHLFAPYHMVNDRRQPYAVLTPRLMMILTICMAAVSIVSWTAARVSPHALYIIPLFFAYCLVIVMIRSKSKAARAQAGK